jgi:hypothetical protein
VAKRTKAQKEADRRYRQSHKKQIREYNRSIGDSIASRMRARRAMVKKHGKSRLRGKDVDHRDSNPLNNSSSNLRISTVNRNRSKNK